MTSEGSINSEYGVRRKIVLDMIIVFKNYSVVKTVLMKKAINLIFS